jgi:hypothetical protein
VGLGVEFGDDIRLDFGYRLDDVPRSFQLGIRPSRAGVPY